MVEIVPIPVAFIDREYRFVYANEAVADQVGVPLAELPGTTLAEVVPNFWPQLEGIMLRALAGETLHNLDLDLRELSPTSRWWMGNFSPVRVDGEVIGVAATSFDVTELRNAQQQLAMRNDLYAMIARTNAAMVANTNKKQLFDEICEIAVETGRFDLAWIGEPADGVLMPVAAAGDDHGYLRAIAEAGRQITTDPADARSHGPTGRAFREGEVSVINDYFSSAMTEPWHDAARASGISSAAAFPIRQGTEVAAVLTIYSATKNYFSEELIETVSEIVPTLSAWMDWRALRLESEETQAQLVLRDRALTAATQGIVITDARAGDHPVIFVTPAFEELTGYPREELIGRNCRFLQGARTDPAARAQIAEPT